MTLDMSKAEDRAKVIAAKLEWLERYVGDLEEKNLGQVIALIRELAQWAHDWTIEFSADLAGHTYHIEYPYTTQLTGMVEYYIRQALTEIMRKFTARRGHESAV